MKTVRSERAEYETCPNCGGAFFDFKEMAEEAEAGIPSVTETAEKVHRGDDLPDRLPADARPCSRCGSQMSEREYSYDSGIHVDMCPKCRSVFLNAKELEEIREYLSTYRNSKESEAINAKIPVAIAKEEADLMQHIASAQARDEKEYAEAVKNDWIPDFLQSTGMHGRILDALDLSIEDQLGAEDT